MRGSLGLLVAAAAAADAVVVSKVLDKSATMRCDTALADLTTGIRITHGSKTVVGGYRQVSSQNKDPIWAMFDGTTQLWCQDKVEVTGDDQDVYGLLWDTGSDALYLLALCTGNQGTPEQDFRQFAKGGWLNNCMGGGASNRGVLAKLDTSTGLPTHATFIGAKLSNGNGNTWKATAMGFDAEGNVVLHGKSFYSPMNADKSPMSCTGKSPFTHHVKFSADLSKMLASCADGCVGKEDCEANIPFATPRSPATPAPGTPLPGGTSPPGQTPAPLPIATAADADDDGLSDGAIVGIVIGVIAFVGLVAAGIFFIACKGQPAEPNHPDSTKA